MADLTKDEVEKAIIKAHADNDQEALSTLIPYYESIKTKDVSELTPGEVPSKYINPALGGAAAGATTAGTLGTVKAVPAVIDWLQNKQAAANARALAPEISRQLFELAPPSSAVPGATPASVSGTGGQNWLRSLAGTGFAGGQMDAESLAKAKQLSSIVNTGGPFAGGSITPAGIALPPSAAAPAARAVEAPLSTLEKMYQSVGRGASSVGRALSPYVSKALGIATPILGATDVGYNLTDAYNRQALQEGLWNKLKAAALPTSAAGAGLTAMLSKNPRVAIPAAVYSATEPWVQHMLDEAKRGERQRVEPEHTDLMGNVYAQGGLVALKEGGSTTPAWQRKEGKNPKGGLNAKGRASYNRETGGHLKPPQPEGGKRKDSFCARMKGMKNKLTSAKTANDPDSRINKSLRAWNC